MTIVTQFLTKVSRNIRFLIENSKGKICTFYYQEFMFNSAPLGLGISPQRRNLCPKFYNFEVELSQKECRSDVH